MLQTAKGEVNTKAATGDRVFWGLHKEGTKAPQKAAPLSLCVSLPGNNSIVGHC